MLFLRKGVGVWGGGHYRSSVLVLQARQSSAYNHTEWAPRSRMVMDRHDMQLTGIDFHVINFIYLTQKFPSVPFINRTRVRMGMCVCGGNLGMEACWPC